MEKISKITFIGDITCDKPLLQASYKDGSYNFEKVFENVKNFFWKSDIVVGNLETVFAGNKAGYNSEYMILNSPDELLNSIRNSNIKIVTCANNHFMDQGIKGLTRTLDILDKNGISHVGAYRNKDEYNKNFNFILANHKISILSATSNINSSNIDEPITGDEFYNIDMLKRDKVEYPNGILGIIKRIFFIFPPRSRRRIKRLRAKLKLRTGKSYFKEITDKKTDGDFENIYFKRWLDKIEKAKSESDIVIVCPHFGGQFNREPGTYSTELLKILLEKNVHVIGNHPHVIQKVIEKEGYIGAYSLGSFNQSLSADYINKKNFPEYSIAINFYIDSSGVIKKTFSIFKSIEFEDNSMSIFLISDLIGKLNINESIKLKKDIEIIYSTVTGLKISNVDIKEEYDL